jgi:hypothetical protein
MQDIDRSFLSQPEVVQASRKWTCIRVATYENAEEAEYLKGIFSGRSGELENTVFAFMDPTARKHLTAPSRGPRGTFSGPHDLASAMDQMAQSYRASAPVSDELPKVESLRLALNIAACEGLPVVVVVSRAAENQLAQAAWAPQNLGQAVYLRAELQEGGQAYIIVPDKFGMKIESSRPLDPKVTAQELHSLLTALQSEPKDHRRHVREGLAKGIRWETAVPVTDPEARY